MSINDQDTEAVEEAVETLEENGFEVRAVDRVYGFEDVEYDEETDEETELGRATSMKISFTKEHY